MVNVILDIDVNKLDVERLLHKLELAISGPSLAAFLEGSASEEFRENIIERFDEEGDALSGFWEPLKDVTVDIKRALPDLAGSPETINVRTGEMFKALTQNYDTNFGADWAQLNVPGDVDALTETKIRTAQQGSNNNPLGYGPTPPRPVLATSEMQLGVILQKLEYHIVDMLVGSIF